MKKFRVYAMFTASKLIGEFEAETRQDAERMAAKTGEEYVSLCHQCSHEIDLGDCYEYQVEEFDK